MQSLNINLGLVYWTYRESRIISLPLCISSHTNSAISKTHHAVFYPSLTLMRCLWMQISKGMGATSIWRMRLPWSHLQTTNLSCGVFLCEIHSIAYTVSVKIAWKTLLQAQLELPLFGAFWDREQDLLITSLNDA